MYRLIRPIFFAMDAERAHHLVMKLTEIFFGWTPMRQLVRSFFRVDDPVLEQTLFGVDFPNPVGLAAGFDKNARHLNVLSAFGFGHIEIGTVTGEEQTGNPKPRLFRLKPDEALLNRMGFNNEGSEKVRERLSHTSIEPVLGVNIGKTKVVPLEDAPSDYEKTFRSLYPFACYFVVNVSSPNTPGLRGLQEKEPLTRLLQRLQTLNEELGGSKSKPILVKIAPDLTDAQVVDVVDVAHTCELDGIVATNTTISREGLRTIDVDEKGAGGISGKPVAERRLEIVRLLRAHTDLPIVGVGGIFTASDALQAILAGANLVQVWTGFVYEGPAMVKKINHGLRTACRANGWANISDAVGLQSEGASA